jgi:hypothetical protein
MDQFEKTRDELAAALNRLGVDVPKARLDAMLPEARRNAEWLLEMLSLDLDGHEPSTRFRPGGR